MHIIPELGPTLLMMIPFIVTAVGSWLILWRPLNQFLDDRELATDGARKEAEEFASLAERRGSDLESKLEAVHQEIVELHAQARNRALAKEADIVATARTKAETYLEEAHARVADERLKAKAELEGQAQGLSSDIVQSLLAGS